MHGPTNDKNKNKQKKTSILVSGYRRWCLRGPLHSDSIRSVVTYSFTFRQYSKRGNITLYFLNLDSEVRIIQTFTIGSPSFWDVTQPRLAKLRHIPEGRRFLAPMRNHTTSQRLHC
jgi:hypothetical protein